MDPPDKDRRPMGTITLTPMSPSSDDDDDDDDDDEDLNVVVPSQECQTTKWDESTPGNIVATFS